MHDIDTLYFTKYKNTFTINIKYVSNNLKEKSPSYQANSPGNNLQETLQISTAYKISTRRMHKNINLLLLVKTSKFTEYDTDGKTILQPW